MHLIRIFALIVAATSIAHAGGRPIYHNAPVRIAEPPDAEVYSLAAVPIVLGAPMVIYGSYPRPVYLVAPSAKIIHVGRDGDRN